MTVPRSDHLNLFVGEVFNKFRGHFCFCIPMSQLPLLSKAERVQLARREQDHGVFGATRYLLYSALLIYFGQIWAHLNVFIAGQHHRQRVSRFNLFDLDVNEGGSGRFAPFYQTQLSRQRRSKPVN